MSSRRLLSVAGSVALALITSIASAKMTKQECAKANADGQGSRLDGKLSDARAQFQRCVDPSCPSIVRDDCAQRLAELDRVQPTLLFDVKDGAGNDVPTVRVSVDGHLVTEKLGGLALPIDPGEHSFAFVSPGLPPLTRTFVLKEGEKDRRERVILGPLPPAPPPLSVGSEAKRGDSAGGLGTQRILGISAAGVGLLGVAVGAIFGVQTFSAVSQQNTACPSAASCPNPGLASSDHATASSDAVVSTVAFIAGGVFVAGGAALFFTAPRATKAASQVRWVVFPTLARGGGGLSFGGEF